MLARRYAEQAPSPDQLVRSHMDLVRKIAWHMHGRIGRMAEIDDMLQALRALAGDSVRIDVVDVDADPLLIEQFDELVPVLAGCRAGQAPEQLCHYHLDESARHRACSLALHIYPKPAAQSHDTQAKGNGPGRLRDRQRDRRRPRPAALTARPGSGLPGRLAPAREISRAARLAPAQPERG